MNLYVALGLIAVQTLLAFKAWPTFLFPRPDLYSVLAVFLVSAPTLLLAFAQKGYRGFWLCGLSTAAVFLPPASFTIPISYAPQVGLVYFLIVLVFSFLVGGVLSGVTAWIWRKWRWSAVLVFPLVMESFRFLHILGAPYAGLLPPPSILLASPLTYVPPLIQMASYTGVFGVDFLVLFISSVIAVGTWEGIARWPWLAERLGIKTEPLPLRGLGIAGGLTTALFLLLGGLFLAGNMEAARVAKLQGKDAPGIKVALVQPNWDIANETSFSPLKQTFVLGKYRDCLLDAVRQKAELAVFPEDIWGESLPEGTKFWNRFRDLVRETKLPTLVGFLTYVTEKRAYNMWYQLDAQAQITNYYHKRYLIPYGEYIPFRGLTEGAIAALNRLFAANYSWLKLTPLSNPRGDVTAGVSERLFTQNGHGYFIKICDELQFPQYFVQGVRLGGEMALSPSTGEWFRNMIYHRHFLALACFRAVENRRWLGRTASLGLAYFVDAQGLVRSASPFNARAVLVEKVPALTYLSFYTRHGDVFGWSCVAMLLGFILAAGWAGLKKPKS